MKTVISEDRIGRFAELDHTVVEEVRAFIETGQEEKQPTRAVSLRELGATLLASIRLSRPS
jgi:hypothetical protein